MAITFPRSVSSFADRMQIASVRWLLQDSQEYSMLGSGEFLAADLGPKLYKADVKLIAMPNRVALDIQADIETLDGALNSFYLYDPRAKYPRQDNTGSILGAANPVIATLGANNKSLTVSGLPAGYILSRGDFFHFDYGTSPVRRAFHRVVETVVANGSGLTPSFEVRPHFRPGVAAGLSLVFAKPAPKVRIIPNTFDPGTAQGSMTDGMAFQVQQTL